MTRDIPWKGKRPLRNFLGAALISGALLAGTAGTELEAQRRPSVQGTYYYCSHSLRDCRDILIMRRGGYYSHSRISPSRGIMDVYEGRYRLFRNRRRAYIRYARLEPRSRRSNPAVYGNRNPGPSGPYGGPYGQGGAYGGPYGQGGPYAGGPYSRGSYGGGGGGLQNMGLPVRHGRMRVYAVNCSNGYGLVFIRFRPRSAERAASMCNRGWKFIRKQNVRRLLRSRGRR